MADLKTQKMAIFFYISDENKIRMYGIVFSLTSCDHLVASVAER
jgi:hypothetical protein